MQAIAFSRKLGHSLTAMLGVLGICGGITLTEGRAEDTGTDPYLWLEEVEGEKALDWVRARNKESLAVLEGDARFKPFEEQALEIVNAADRIPYGVYRGGHVYNFWQDETHVRGIWRRTSLDSYRSDAPEWETILDVDALADAEEENWVYKGVSCLAPDYTRCLLTLSRGGKDASVIREYDIEKKAFVDGGFVIPEAKSRFSWLDEDRLLVGSDFGEGSLTSSGYPRIIKLWARGTDLAEAKTVFEGEVDDVSVSSFTIKRPTETVTLIVRSFSFFDRTYYVLDDAGGLRELPMPSHVDLEDLFAGHLLLTPQKDWTVGDTVHEKGTLLAMDLASFMETGDLPPLQTLYKPDERSAVQGVSASRSAVVVSILSNVTSTMKRFRFEDGAWQADDIALPENGSANVSSINPFNDTVFVNYESFLVPDTLYALDVADLSLAPLKQLPERFSADGLVTRQLEATSKDGTKVPYFVIHREDLALDGTNPTLLYGYGGFRIPLDPSYSGITGKLWLERGGVYVIANIRGGGEFGPRWHEAALKLNRQRAYDDFIAVGEDLVARKITSPRHLGIYGGSNGGLLVGVAFTQRPDLMNAVLCAVPLLDMLRYHKLLAGASWIGEYGDPDIAEERAAIAAYSPYQNVKPDVSYPEVFFVTSTKDDRVHPGHARKMAARMMEQGHAILYYENIEGGHSASANLKQIAYRLALQYVYLSRKLMDQEGDN